MSQRMTAESDNVIRKWKTVIEQVATDKKNTQTNHYLQKKAITTMPERLIKLQSQYKSKANILESNRRKNKTIPNTKEKLLYKQRQQNSPVQS